MRSLLIKITVFFANRLPSDIYFEQRLYLTKLFFITFLAGFLAAIISYFLAGYLFKWLKSRSKQRKRIRRLKGKKISGAVFVGEVNQFFRNINVAVIEIMAKKLQIGDIILIKGNSTDTRFSIESMQINRKDVISAAKGAEVGLKVPVEVKPGDLVYKVKAKK